MRFRVLSQAFAQWKIRRPLVTLNRDETRPLGERGEPLRKRIAQRGVVSQYEEAAVGWRVLLNPSQRLSFSGKDSILIPKLHRED
ncbi:MAG: hypothetical protein DCC56_07800 [Anaerolineae bacterium]|nr:MAG: hypothetical protein DCC56_07800 [Anaerolineae bacterium]